MPVLMLMTWDLLACVAWPSAPSATWRRESVSGGNAPPSRLSASWILVSFVSRAKAAQRGVVLGEAIVVFVVLMGVSSWVLLYRLV